LLTIMVSKTPNVSPRETDLLAADIDLRLGIDVWAEVWQADTAQPALIAALLRAAYGLGYVDALTEPRRGQLCRDHGFAIPPRQL
jgi:hypothetical protein